jgi:hypothetical protein
MKVYWPTSLVLLFANIGVYCSIGQSIRIESAYYGPPKAVVVDVTRRVQRFADYGEPFRVGNDTLSIDLFPNRPKVLVVIYDVNGQRISDRVREGDVFYFRNAGEFDSNLEEHRPAIRIVRALYGVRKHYVDVTHRVRQLTRDRQSFTVSNETFGVDPYPGQQKWLKVSYLRGGVHRNQQYEEGEKVQLRYLAP